MFVDINHILKKVTIILLAKRNPGQIEWKSQKQKTID